MNIFEPGETAPKILIADDDPSILRLLADRCSLMGFEVEIACNGMQALRRIRQGSQGKLLNDELRISADSVAVYYFNPTPDGTTAVTTLRVSPDGDFLDRWPRGFFAERDAELFDE